MKQIILIFLCLFGALTASAQDKSTATATIAVKGNCEECKKRIENAADIKGVKFSEWDEVRQLVTVTYKTDKVTLEQIEKAIADSGHDTKNIKGSGAAYSKLPSCCKYRDKKCEADKK